MGILMKMPYTNKKIETAMTINKDNQPSEKRMPKITIVRPYEWFNQRKKIDLFVDGQHVGHIGVNKTVHFEVSAGKHTLTLNNLWPARNNTIEVDLTDRKDKTLLMTSSKITPWIAFGGTLVVTFFYSLVKAYFDVGDSWAIEIGVVTLLFVIVLLVVWRTKHLKLEEVGGE